MKNEFDDSISEARKSIEDAQERILNALRPGCIGASEYTDDFMNRLYAVSKMLFDAKTLIK